MKPTLDDDGRAKAIAKVAAWLDAADPEAGWTGEVAAEGGYLLKRLWRGVTDAHVIEKGFLVSAEARKLHALASRAIARLRRPVDAARAQERRRARRRRPLPTPEPLEGEDAADAAEAAEAIEAETTRKTIPISRPSELLDAVLAAGRRGLSISRYKGLGEMNPEQLWETTLDPANRSLLRVEVTQADVADEIFTRLMGDVVEPRREFIQENALNVANLDV